MRALAARGKLHEVKTSTAGVVIVFKRLTATGEAMKWSSGRAL